jgi:hypothetical protein
VGVGSVACAAALAVVPLARAENDVLVEVGLRIAVLALLALVASLVLCRPVLLPVCLFLLGGLYAAQLAVDDAALDGAAPLVAAGLLATAELGYWALEEREPVTADPGETLRRIGFVALLVLGALLVAGSLLALVDVVRARGLAFDLVGAAAAALVLTVVVVAHRAGRASA